LLNLDDEEKPAPRELANDEVPLVPPKCELSMCESARFVETEEPLREDAKLDAPPRAALEFEVTPGVKLDPRELAKEFGVEARPALFVVEERLPPFVVPPRTEFPAE
jgi:hypothetical protein